MYWCTERNNTFKGLNYYGISEEMDTLRNVLINEWSTYNNEEQERYITFLLSQNEIHIHKDTDILIGIIYPVNHRIMIDLSRCTMDFLRSSLSYFLVRTISSTLIGVPILIAGTQNFY
jgi:hypothetical protein